MTIDFAALLKEIGRGKHAARSLNLEQSQALGSALAANTVPDGVLALTPADYNANRKVLKPFVAATKEARGEAKLASKTARKILHLLAGDTEDEKEHGWGEGRHDSDK